MVMFKFLVYYAIPLCVIAAFYLGMARHLALSTRNMPGELPNNDHRIDQLRTRRRVRENTVLLNIYRISNPYTINLLRIVSLIDAFLCFSNRKALNECVLCEALARRQFHGEN